MQIILNQDEIEQAIDAYVRSQISINDDQEVAVELKAGRGENAFSATLDIRQAQPKTAPKKTATRSRPTAVEPALTNNGDAPVTRAISATPEDRQPPTPAATTSIFSGTKADTVIVDEVASDTPETEEDAVSVAEDLTPVAAEEAPVAAPKPKSIFSLGAGNAA